MRTSKFSLSHYNLLSMDMGELVPCGLVEVLPGDIVQHSVSALVRAAPLLAPVMHPVRVQVHCWFVPHRLVWEDWEDFITGGPTNTDASVFPTITIGGGSGAAVGSLADYLGVPTGVNNIEVSALPFRAYAKIWNEFYRDQDLQTELVVDETSGPDNTTNTALQNTAWEKDYFTSARPWEQKGPSITIPIGSTAPIHGVYASSAGNTQTIAGAQPIWGVTPAGTVSMSANPGLWLASKSAVGTNQGTAFNATNTNVFADLSGASAVTVTALREALALQRYAEKVARYGSRYVEYLRSWGVRSSDARLQRPEYIGGGRQTIQFSEVLQTGPGTDPVGDLKGHGIGAMRSNRYRKYFEEHGYIMCLMSVKPKTMYYQGLARTWNKRFKEDFYQPELAHIGQQEVLNKEVYAAHSSPNGTFGYQDRYDEYRRMESRLSGEFRSTLNYWHFARAFSSDPALNATFVKAVPPETPFAVPAEDVLQVMVKHQIAARRLVSGSAHSFIF